MTEPLPFATFRPAELTPADRATAVTALLAAGRLRVLRPDTFPPPAADTISQEFSGEST